ncbi:MAG TPA: HAMP domain-containing sensor histidine kinase [Segeticoccus sp.]|uniref:sensor histidine kinase n=1 Tax=Segeticoccus sp. TaxID=2706531 RepID=UPI002D80339E|nr:HAMP domain-containing sensor histidine kinase [Segeticoccus sp.]HET8600017.1 HAMP domain-containing sensor histidine kinase [Segeticoccus sp.]
MLGLRRRVTLAFGLLALALSVLLAVVVWLLVSSFLLNQQQSNAVSECSVDAVVLQSDLDTSPRHVPDVLQRLPTTSRVASIVSYNGGWYSTRLSFSRSTLPHEVFSEAASGTTATQRFRLGDQTYLAVAVPLREPGDVYAEVYPLQGLQDTVRTLTVVLIASAAGTAAVGLGLGRLASRRALRPLTELNAVAGRVARGDRGIRLEAAHDPDLADLATSFNHTVESLDQRVEADARFAGDVSHQLRTPLTTMLTSMELLRKHRDQMPLAAREPLDLLDGDLANFRRLVLDLLEISRDDSGAPMVLERVRLVDLVRAAADTVASRPVTTAEPGALDVVVVTDKRRLEQVVTNLVENAELHGAECLAVQVCLEGEDAMRLVVDDRGPGIPEASRDRLFERFVRGERPVGTGSGLGLAIVARHVRALHGTVEVLDRPGGGARFVLHLPRNPAEWGRP